MHSVQNTRALQTMRLADCRSLHVQSRRLHALLVPCKHSLAHSSQLSAVPTRNVEALTVFSPKQHVAGVDIAYELVQGPLVRYTRQEAVASPPTAVLVHGILGSRRNLQSFASLFTQAHPSWQVLLVDLRCHGESAAHSHLLPGSHGVSSAASDVLRLLRNLKMFPNALVGHSFGGKVVMEMVQQFGLRLPRPVQVWVLDTLPGEVRAGDANGLHDHPRDLISSLLQMPLPISNRTQVYDCLISKRFSPHIAQWVCTNLRSTPNQSGLSWTFDLPGIFSMYDSYESTSLWPLLQHPPEGLRLDFVKAERSSWRWEGEDDARIMGLGHQVHLLRNAGHWVHTDNPQGLLDIMSPSFVPSVLGASSMKS